MKIIIKTKLEKLEEKFKQINWHKNPDGEWISDEVSLGWFILLEGSHEYLHVGDKKPPLRVGSMMRITIEDWS